MASFLVELPPLRMGEISGLVSKEVKRYGRWDVTSKMRKSNDCFLFWRPLPLPFEFLTLVMRQPSREVHVSELGQQTF